MAELKYLVDINLLQNQLIFPKIHSLGTAPSSPSPVEGQLYFDSSAGDKALHVYNGSAWVRLAGQTAAQTVDTIATGDFIAFSDESETGDINNKLTIDNLFKTAPKLVSTAAIANGDFMLFLDGGATGEMKKEAVADIATLFAGAGMTATDSVLNVIGTTGAITVSADAITLPAALTVVNTITNTGLKFGRDTHNFMDFGTDDVIKFTVGTNQAITFKPSGEIEATKFDGALEGNADTATALAATGNIAATGDITWNVDFSGSDVTATAAIGTGVIINSDVNASAAIVQTKIDTDVDLGGDIRFGDQPNDTVEFAGHVSSSFTSTGSFGLVETPYGVNFTGDNHSDQGAKIFYTNASSEDKIILQVGTRNLLEVHNPYTGTTGEVVVNEDSLDVDFRVESNGNDHMIYSDGNTNRVGIGKNNPTTVLDVNGPIALSGAITGATTIDASTDFTVGNLVITDNTLTGTAIAIAGGSGEIDLTTTGAMDLNSAGFTLDASTISIDAVNTTNITTTGTGKHMTINAAGGGTQVLTLASAGTGANAIDINATAGGLDVDVVKDIALTTTGDTGEIQLISAHGEGRAVFIDANVHAGSIVDIDAGVLDIDVERATTLDTTGFTVTSPIVTFTSADSNDPIVSIINTNDDATGASLKLIKNTANSAANNDVAGIISFLADDAGNNETEYGRIKTIAAAVTAGSESGKMLFGVATTSTGAYADILTITGGANAAGSTVAMTGHLTVAGDLTVTGDTITASVGTLDVEDKNITINKSSGDSSGTADGAGITIQDAVDASNDATILWTASSDTFTFSHPINADVTGDLTGTADAVTNATLTTALTVNTGTLTLTANSANNSVVTIGAGAVGISGANTGDETTSRINALDITEVGALASGTIASDFGAIDNGVSGIRTNIFTAETSFLPDADDGATLGSENKNFSDVFLADGAVLNFGDDQDVKLTHVADAGLLLNSTMAIQFNDASQYIKGSSATELEIGATDQINLESTLIDINGNVEISGTATTTGVHTFTEIPSLPINSIDTAEIAALAVETAKINNLAVTTAKIADNTVTVAKLVDLARGSIIIGNASAASEELTKGTAGYVLTSDGTDIAWAEATGATYKETIGDTSATTFEVTHSLNTTDVMVQLYDVSSLDTVYAQVIRTTVNTIDITFNAAPGNNDIRVLVTKI